MRKIAQVRAALQSAAGAAATTVYAWERCGRVFQECSRHLHDAGDIAAAGRWKPQRGKKPWRWSAPDGGSRYGHPLLELAAQYPGKAVEIVPGLTARPLLAGARRDFALRFHGRRGSSAEKRPACAAAGTSACCAPTLPPRDAPTTRRRPCEFAVRRRAAAGANIGPGASPPRRNSENIAWICPQFFIG